MKKIILSLFLCFITYIINSQETYVVNGESYLLIKESSGNINLLWNIVDRNYRYFVQKDNNITELINTKDENNNYKDDYKKVLKNLTIDQNLSVDRVKLTLPSLKTFIDKYNASKDSNYIIETKAKIQTKFSILGGVTNSPFIEKLEKAINPVFGIEFEFSEAVEFSRHSLYFQGKQVIASNKFDYSATQIIVGYRFRIINKKSFNFYTNIDLAQYKFTRISDNSLNEIGELINDKIKENGFEVPFIFGIGTDIKLSETSYLSLLYNELFAILLKNEGDFPVSFAVGYKLKI